MLQPCQRKMLARDTEDKQHAMSQKLNNAIAVIGIDIGKNSFHLVGHDKRGATAVRTVLPFHSISRGRPTFTESSCAIWTPIAQHWQCVARPSRAFREQSSFL